MSLPHESPLSLFLKVAFQGNVSVSQFSPHPLPSPPPLSPLLPSYRPPTKSVLPPLGSPKALAARRGAGGGWNRPDRSAGERGAERGNPPGASGGGRAAAPSLAVGPAVPRARRSAPSLGPQ